MPDDRMPLVKRPNNYVYVRVRLLQALKFLFDHADVREAVAIDISKEIAFDGGLETPLRAKAMLGDTAVDAAPEYCRRLGIKNHENVSSCRCLRGTLRLNLVR
jgi:hypothetical protein